MDLEKKQETVVTKGKEWAVGFGQSDFYKNLSPDLKMNALGIIENYILLMFNTYDRLPGKWTQKDTVSVIAEEFPKEAEYEDYAEGITPVLSAFFNYLGQENLIKNSDTLMRGLEKVTIEVSTKETTLEDEVASVDLDQVEEVDDFIQKQQEKQEEVHEERKNHLIEPEVLNGKKQPIRVTKIGRNDPCPCGSGKKYKKCHGR